MGISPELTDKLDKDMANPRNGAKWTPFGIYSAKAITEHLGTVPSTAVKIRLPEKLERVLGEFYRLDSEDRNYIRNCTTSRFIAALQEAAKIASREAHIEAMRKRDTIYETSFNNVHSEY